MIYHGGHTPENLYHAGSRAGLVVTAGQLVYANFSTWESTLPALEFRITEEMGANGLEKWAEWGFVVDYDELDLVGNASAGWVDGAGFCRAELQRSETLTDWSLGQLTDCAGSPEDNGDGSYTFWARSPYPIDSAIKTGFLSADNYLASGTDSHDSRQNPFISITLAGVVQYLPNFPYWMPGDAPQMQTDLRAAGWTGSTVTATSDVLWAIVVPGVFQDSYILQNRVEWPLYLVPDMYGNIVNPCSGRSLAGTWVNAANVRTAVSKQFARLKMTQLKS